MIERTRAARRIHQAIAAVCPIVGFFPGSSLETSRIDFTPEATAEQRATAASVLAAFDWNDEAAQVAWELAAAGQDIPPAIRTISQVLDSQTPLTDSQIKAFLRFLFRRQFPKAQ